MKNCEQQSHHDGNIFSQFCYVCVCVCVCVDFSPHISKMISKGYLINIGCDAVIEDYLLVDEEQKLRVFQIKM